jgi:hypothetical protein
VANSAASCADSLQPTAPAQHPTAINQNQNSLIAEAYLCAVAVFPGIVSAAAQLGAGVACFAAGAAPTTSWSSCHPSSSSSWQESCPQPPRWQLPWCCSCSSTAQHLDYVCPPRHLRVCPQPKPPYAVGSRQHIHPVSCAPPCHGVGVRMPQSPAFLAAVRPPGSRSSSSSSSRCTLDGQLDLHPGGHHAA